MLGGVQVYFLRDPEIDYSLGGVAGALDVPGLSKIVENIISEQGGRTFVHRAFVQDFIFPFPLVKTLWPFWPYKICSAFLHFSSAT